MGFLSKIWKKATSLTRGLIKGIKKVAGKIFGSKLGKILMFAIAIYTGGMALGVFQNPFVLNAAGTMQGLGLSKTMTGAIKSGMSFTKALGHTIKATGKSLVSAVTGQTAPAEITLNASSNIATDLGIDASVGAVDAGIAGSPFSVADAAAKSLGQTGLSAQGSTLGSQMGLAKSAVSSSVLPSATSSITSLATSGATKGLFGKTLAFMNNNKLLTLMGANAIAGAFGDDEIDILRERERLQKERWADFDPGIAAWEGKKAGEKRRATRPTVATNRPRSSFGSLMDKEGDDYAYSAG